MTPICKKVICSLFVMGSIISVYGQSYFGVKGGVNLSNMRIVLDGPPGFQSLDPSLTGNETTVIHTKTALRIVAGAYYFLSLSKKSGIQVDLLYQGFGIRDGMKLNYISMPVSYCYALNNRFSFSAGAYAAINMGGDDFVEKYTNRMDYGATLGSEFTLTKKIAFGAKYYYGLSNVENPSLVDVSKNRAFQFYTAYKFVKN